jgi:hypothetical protein
LCTHDGTAFGADSEEKHEPASDVDTVVVDSLKALSQWLFSALAEAELPLVCVETRHMRFSF